MLWPFSKQKKIEKRGSGYTNWIPWTSATSDSKGKFLAGNLSQIRRGLQLYADLLSTTPLVAINKGSGLEEKNNNVLEVLNKPNRFNSQDEFWTRLVESYFLDGNFYCLIQHNNQGRITALLPFLPGTMYAYAAGPSSKGVGAHNDPVLLNNPASYFYRSQFGTGDNIITKNYSPDDIWHIKSTWQSQDLINGASIYEAYSQTIEAAQDTLESTHRYAKSGGVGPVLVGSEIQTESPEEKQALREAIDTFFENKGQVLTLPAAVKVEQLLAGQPMEFIRFLASLSSLSIARLLSIPVQILEREDGVQQSGGGQNLKETFRFWVKTSGRSFLKRIERKLEELDPATKFEFKIKSVQSSDMRELAMSISQLVTSGAMTPEEAREWLKT